jgi:hypothetical protein
MALARLFTTFTGSAASIRAVAIAVPRRENIHSYSKFRMLHRMMTGFQFFAIS